MSNKEEWKDIQGYEGLYQISSFGRVFSIRKKRLLKTIIQNKGYVSISLSKNGVNKRLLAHRLVAINFIENSNMLPQVNHKDGNKLNNSKSNLEWTNNSKNQLHARSIGLNNCAKEKCHLSKLSESEINEIRDLYSKGVYQSVIASQFNIHQSNVSLIINKKTWK